VLTAGNIPVGAGFPIVGRDGLETRRFNSWKRVVITRLQEFQFVNSSFHYHPRPCDWIVYVGYQLSLTRKPADTSGTVEAAADPSQLAIQLPGGVSTGADTAGWAVSATLVAPGQLRVGLVSSRGRALPVGLREIARLQLHVEGGE